MNKFHKKLSKISDEIKLFLKFIKYFYISNSIRQIMLLLVFLLIICQHFNISLEYFVSHSQIKNSTTPFKNQNDNFFE